MSRVKGGHKTWGRGEPLAGGEAGLAAVTDGSLLPGRLPSSGYRAGPPA